MDLNHKVIRDTKEKDGHGWWFDDMVTRGLKTGDYTLEGYEKVLCIERKATTGEFSQNIVQARFERELERMDQYKYPFVILEFDIVDVHFFPENSGIPKDKWPELKITPQFMLKKIAEFEVKYRAKFIFASKFGREKAIQIFKEVIRAGG